MAQAWPTVEIGGSKLSDELESLLELVIVDQHLHLPDMFALTFHDPERDVLSKLNAQMASDVTIKMTPEDSQSPETLIKGEITAFEAEYDSRNRRTVLRGYDKSHRLHSGRTTETYKNVTDSDVVRKVVQRAGLSIGTIDSTTTTHEHISQANLSDWDFLKARAREIGYELGIDDQGKFFFRKPLNSSQAPSAGNLQGSGSNPLQLVFGDDLIEFRPRLTAVQQVGDVKVRGWDPSQKQNVIGSANATTTSATLNDTPSAVAGNFGSKTHVASTLPLATQDEADAAAAAIAEEIGSAFAEAEGVARGNPKLKSGATVSIGVVGDKFSGQYTLSGVKHVFSHAGYRTHFRVSGRHDRSLLGLTSLGSTNGSHSAGGPPINGVVVGIVTDNNDPNNQGRVKLKFPWMADQYETHWARLVSLGAGPNSGSVFIPEVNDEVLVAFEHGDIRRPYVVGSLWNGQDTPNLGQSVFDNGKLKRRGFVSRLGHKFVLFDDSSKSGVALITSDGNLKIALNESNSEIHITCGNGKVILKSQGDMTLDSGADLNLKAQQTIKLEAQQDVKLEAQSSAEMKGNSGATVQSSGQTVVKGSVVMIN